MAQEYPSLLLSDIMHSMSPSPAPPLPSEEPPAISQTRSMSPGPIDENDVQNLRQRVLEMGLTSSDSGSVNSRERELADMVMRLTHSARPDSEQLLNQAQAISALDHQRDFLLRQAKEQRMRWQAERDGWARTTEALISQRAKDRANSIKDDDAERQRAIFESDNKALRQKLRETQLRLSALQSELAKLRPLLLMQPLVVPQSPSKTTDRQKSQNKRENDSTDIFTPNEDTHRSEDDFDDLAEVQETSFGNFNTTPKQRSHQTNIGAPSTNISSPLKKGKEKKASSRLSLRPISSDARIEFLLLAARKIGKERAGIMSGLMQHFDAKARESDRAREKKREDMNHLNTTPKTPKKNNAALHPASAHPQTGGFVYMNSPVLHPGMHPGTQASPVPILVPVPTTSYHLLQTPSSSTLRSSPSQHPPTFEERGRTQRANPLTPLDSLLSAARSMMDDDDESVDSNGTNGSVSRLRTRRSSYMDMPESPVPKRRRLAPGTSSRARTVRSGKMDTTPDEKGQSFSTNIGRVKSALDVLADQAAAFSSQEQGKSGAKGKGKEKSGHPISAPDFSDKNIESIAHDRASTRDKSKATLDSSAGERSSQPILRRSPSGERTPRQQPMSPRPSALRHVSSGAYPDKGSTSFGDACSPSNGRLAQGFSKTANLSSRDDLSHPPPSFESQTSAKSTQSQGNDVEDRSSLPPHSILHLEKSLSPSRSHRRLSLADSPAALSRAQSEDNVNGNGRASESGSHRRACSLVVIPDQRPSDSNSPLQTHVRHDTAPSTSNTGKAGTVGARNKDLAGVVSQETPAKRPRSPYVKWSKEEDEMLAQAVAKYGQKWDLVQKALPSRGYHQVRQRWLRKLGVFDTKPDLSSFQTNTYMPASRGISGGLESSAPAGPPPNPKLGLAPLSSELGFPLFTPRGPTSHGEGRLPPTA